MCLSRVFWPLFLLVIQHSLLSALLCPILKNFWLMVFLLSTFISRKFYYFLPFLCLFSSSLLTPTIKVLDLTLTSDFSKLASTYENEQMTLVFVTRKLLLLPSCLIIVSYVCLWLCCIHTNSHTYTHIHTESNIYMCVYIYNLVNSVFVVCVHMVAD